MESLAHQIIFWILGGTMVVSALGVILAKNTINSVMSLLVTMLAMAGFYVLMSVTVVALFQVIICVGTVLVLFLLVTMLRNLREVSTPFPMTPALWTAGIVSFVITCTVGWVLWRATAQTGLLNGYDIREIS
ncbi:MAG: NADH-quinone oxidoreductase subunit J, partial [Deltaproteobacteria bacterium]|nr:NADH-quinone oxidoreductase subunit J [Deltaproteobacteria bacterium]